MRLSRIEHAETAGGTRIRRPAILTGTRRTYDLQSSTSRSLRASPEERETRRRANADATREARARESREEAETRRRANADATREARARESQEEGETRRRANADAMREARARRIADRGWQILPLHRKHTPTPYVWKYCCSHPNVHRKVAEASEVSDATCNIHDCI